MAVVDVGSMFGKYRLERLLGRGGMGEVYEAYDTSKDRTVALKILNDTLARDDDFRTRFQRESRAAAMLDEPHVIPIHDWGEIDGNLYIDMRLVRGENLHDMLKRGPLEPARAVAIVRQVAAALDAAHAHGLIHRDIKPQNILITGVDDFAYLIDFGIAESRGDTRLTNTGSTLGSFAHIAPERFSDQPATAAVDTYSLAGVLCEALTGQAPFKQSSVEQIIAAHISSPPPRPSALNPRVPAALDDVIVRGMAKEPDDRYGSPGALARAAQRALAETPPRAPDPQSSNPTTNLSPPPIFTAQPAAQPHSPPPPMTPPEPAPAPAKTRPWLIPTAIAGGLALVAVAVFVALGGNSRNESAAPSAALSTGYSNSAAPSMNSTDESPSAGAAPPAYAPQGPSVPPGLGGPDNSASHESCGSFSLTNRSGFGTHSSRGSGGTSCFFARSVLVSYWNRYGDASRQPRSVAAPGAVDCRTVKGGVAVCAGADFVLQCAAEGVDVWITCRGGSDAIVYLY